MKSFLQSKEFKIFLLFIIQVSLFFIYLSLGIIVKGYLNIAYEVIVAIIINLFIVSVVTVMVFSFLKVKPIFFIFFNLFIVFFISWCGEELIFHYIFDWAWGSVLSNIGALSIYLPVPFILSLFKKYRKYFFYQEE